MAPNLEMRLLFIELVKVLSPNSSKNRKELTEKLLENEYFLANVCPECKNKKLSIKEKNSIKKEIYKAYHFLAKKKIIKEEEKAGVGMHPVPSYQYKLRFGHSRTMKKITVKLLIDYKSKN